MMVESSKTLHLDLQKYPRTYLLARRHMPWSPLPWLCAAPRSPAPALAPAALALPCSPCLLLIDTYMKRLDPAAQHECILLRVVVVGISYWASRATSASQ